MVGLPGLIYRKIQLFFYSNRIPLRFILRKQRYTCFLLLINRKSSIISTLSTDIVSNFAETIAGMMKRLLVRFFASCCLVVLSIPSIAQCSICTKTAQQLGEGPAKALNGAIIYLAFIPLLLIGVIGYRWWQGNRGSW